MPFILSKRQTTYDNDNEDDGFWGYSTTGIAIKWAVVGAILVLLMLWLVLGRMHAQRRIRRGQRPMMYHSFLVPRQQRARFYPQPQFATAGPGWGSEGYPMQAYPPPAYNTDHVPPPVYQPPDHVPDHGTKINPHQDWAAVPPPGPPPGHHDNHHDQDQAGESSRTMETVPLDQDEQRQNGTAAQQQPHVETENRGMMARLNPFK